MEIGDTLIPLRRVFLNKHTGSTDSFTYWNHFWLAFMWLIDEDEY